MVLDRFYNQNALLILHLRPTLGEVMNIRFFSLGFFLLTSCSSVQFAGEDRRNNQNSNTKIPPTSIPPRVSPQVTQTPSPPNVVANPSTSNVQYRSEQDSPEAGRFYLQARQKYDSGNRKEGLAEIQRYLGQFPKGQFADEATFLLAKQAFDNNDAEGAAKLFQRISEMSPPSKLRGDAIYFEALSHSQLGRRKDALATLAKIDIREVNAENRAKVFTLWAKLAGDEGRFLEATLALVKARKELVLPAQQKEIDVQVDDQIENRLSEAELNFLVKEYPVEYPNGQAQLRLVTLKLAQGNRTEATAILEGILATQNPGSALHVKASQLLSRMQSLGDARVERVGAILPLSGRQETIGRAIADGLQMGVKNAGSSTEVDVVLADSGPSEESAIQAFERLVFEEKVMGIVGPPSGAQAEVLAKKAGEFGIPYIATAARPGLLEKGGNFVFRLALTPERQVRALVGYAKDRLSARRFAILFPEDNFGKEFASEFFKAVKDFEGEVTAAESYRVGQTDFKVQLENMLGLGFPGFRKSEYETLYKELEEKLQRKPSRKESEELLKPVLDFDVIFIPESAKTLGQIVPALSSILVNEKMPQLMGPATWKNSETLLRTGQYLDNAIFVDAWSPERQSKMTQDFLEKFKLKKGSNPNVFSAQGFDIGMAIRLAYGTRAPSGRDELRARLENLGSVDGTLGIHTWDSKREVLSELQLYQIKRGAFVHQGGITIKAKE